MCLNVMVSCVVLFEHEMEECDVDVHSPSHPCLCELMWIVSHSCLDVCFMFPCTVGVLCPFDVCCLVLFDVLWT